MDYRKWLPICWIRSSLIKFCPATSVYIAILTILSFVCRSKWTSSHFNCKKTVFGIFLWNFKMESHSYSSVQPFSIQIIRRKSNSKKFNAKDKVLAVFWNFNYEHEIQITFKICTTLYYKQDSHPQIVFTLSMYTVTDTDITRNERFIVYVC